ncbi:ArsR family transcriptional regulator, partial [Halorubrum sp. SP9]
EDLDISPMAAEMILQVLRPVVHEHYEIDESGAGLNELDIDGDG